MSDEEKLQIAKDAVRVKIIRVYEDRGLKASLDMSDRFLEEAAKTGKELDITDFGKIIRGELSEIYSEICMREYVKTHKNSFYVKSLCFPRPDIEGRYTELDLTLFTEKFVMILECKSYSGEKTLTNEGCMNVKGRTSYNVFSQNRMHLQSLNPYISRCRLKTVAEGGKPYLLCMFSYSKDPIEDLRTEEAKKKFRLLTEDTIMDYLNNMSKQSIIWDIPKLYSVVSKMNEKSEECKIKHIEIMKKLQAERQGT